MAEKANINPKVLVWARETARFSVEHKAGGPNPYRLLVNKNSILFTKIVRDAFRGGYVQPTQASSLVNAPTNKFPQLEAFLYA